MARLLLRLLLLPPHLLKMHVHGYADLASEEWDRQLCAWKSRLLMQALAAASAFLAVFLAGVALLLWTALPVLADRTAWLMGLVPFVLGLFALACWIWARSIRVSPAFGKLREQIALDILALRQSQNQASTGPSP